MNLLLAAAAFIVLHTADGGEVLINPTYIATLHPTRESSGRQNQLVTGGVNCVVSLSNGKFYSVIEDCLSVRKAMDAAR